MSVAFINSTSITDDSEPVAIEPSKQRSGDPAKGFQYLTTGDYIKSGVPYSIFRMRMEADTNNFLNRTDQNKHLSYEYTAVTAPNGEMIVTPNCLQCHAQVFDGTLVVGLGNSFSDFTINRKNQAVMLEAGLKMGFGGKKLEAARNFITVVKSISPDLVTSTKGVNLADALAALLVAHRDPQTFKWSDDNLLPLPTEIIPTDVPAWWLLKKKNAMFYNGFGRGDFGRFLMASNLLTVTDTSEAAEVDSHFNDVLAYINSINAPKYPKAIDEKLAAKGETVFLNTCSGCHGTYGERGKYPNLLIPEAIIQTDSLLYTSNYSSPQFVDWFNKSWFTTGDHPAALVPYRGYIAPPLDGIWITAPYLHNGSIPDLDVLLNSKKRPAYWQRSFDTKDYNYEVPGWNYVVKSKPGNNEVYNTTEKGYSNVGHTFGDHLTDNERKAVIEYLKTL